MPDSNRHDLDRPDPSLGVFETLLVVDGRPVELEAHLARLAAGLRALFATRLHASARELLLRSAAGLRIGRLRLTARPQRGDAIGLQVHGEEVDPGSVLPGTAHPVALRSFAVPGGLGAHKWADRTLLERAEATAPPDSVVLLTDRDGTVLETSRANVFAVRAGAVVTPPADGRILPGIARAVAIECLRDAGIEVSETPMPIAELTASEEVFLTGSVRGVELGGSLDGSRLQSAGRVTDLIVKELRQRWLGRQG